MLKHVRWQTVLLSVASVLIYVGMASVDWRFGTLRDRYVVETSYWYLAAFVPFVALFSAAEGRLGVVVTFLAVMELIKESLVEIVQTENFGPIHVKARSE